VRRKENQRHEQQLLQNGKNQTYDSTKHETYNLADLIWLNVKTLSSCIISSRGQLCAFVFKDRSNYFRVVCMFICFSIKLSLIVPYVFKCHYGALFISFRFVRPTFKPWMDHVRESAKVDRTLTRPRVTLGTRICSRLARTRLCPVRAISRIRFSERIGLSSECLRRHAHRRPVSAFGDTRWCCSARRVTAVGPRGHANNVETIAPSKTMITSVYSGGQTRWWGGWRDISSYMTFLLLCISFNGTS